MKYKFRSSIGAGLQVWKADSIVAVFVNKLFETDDLNLALYLKCIEGIKSIGEPVIEPLVIDPVSDEPRPQLVKATRKKKV